MFTRKKNSRRATLLQVVRLLTFSCVNFCMPLLLCLHFLFGTTWLHILCLNESIYRTNFKKHPHILFISPGSKYSCFIYYLLICFLCLYSPQSKIQAIEAKLQKMQDRNPSMDLKAVPGSSQLSVVQREARLKQLELINAKKQSRKPYKRWSVTALLPYNGESQSGWMKASDPWSTTYCQNGHLVMLLTWSGCMQF